MSVPAARAQIDGNTTLVPWNVAVTDANGNPMEGLKRTDFSITEDGKRQDIAVFAFQGTDLDSSPPDAKRGPLRYLNRRLITFLFDFTLMPGGERTRVLDNVIDFINNGLKPGELLSIGTVTAGVGLTALDFTADQALLTEAVNKFRTAEDGNPSEFDTFNGSAGLASIAAACRRMPVAADKNLLYFSGSIEYVGAENLAALDSAINACAQANVSVYPIGSPQTFEGLATKTGGHVFAGLQAAIDDVRRQFRPHYCLGYYSTNSKVDGAYRLVQVTLLPAYPQQVKLNYNAGYFAGLVVSRLTDADSREFVLQRLLSRGDPIVDLPLAVEVDYFRIAPNLYRVPVTVDVPGSAAALEKQWGFQNARLDFEGLIASGTQPGIRMHHDSIDVPLTQPMMEELSSTPIIVTTQTMLPSGESTLNLVALENEIRLAGTFRGSLNIPDLDAETQNIPMSSMMLGTDPHPIPNVTHVFAKNQSVHVYSEAYDALPDRLNRLDVTATVTLLNTSGIVFESKPLTPDRFAPERDRTLPISLEIPLNDLPAGLYTVRLSVVDNNAHKSGTRESKIRIQPDGQPDPPSMPEPPPDRRFSTAVRF